MKSDVKGTSSDPITSSIGSMQPARLPGVANCQWQLSKGAAVLPGVILATQAVTQAGTSPTTTPVNTAAAVTSLAAASSGTAKEVPFVAEHVGIRIYKVALQEDLKPGEYAFFMATGQQVNGTEGRGTGGAATGRIYDFSLPE